MLEILTLVAPIVGILFAVIVVITAVRYVLNRYVPVPPNKALIVYGRGGMRTITAGGTFVLPVLEKTDILSLDIMTITVKADEVKTISGVPILVDWTAQIKVSSEESGIRTAAQVFLGLAEDQVKEKAQLTLGGNLREVISKLTVLQVHTDRDAFIGSVQQIIADEMKAMGLMIVSMTIQDVYDPDGQTYFKDLAAKDIAEVQKTARIVRATADREATECESKEAEAKQLAIYRKETAIAEAEKNKNLQIAEFKKLADKAAAESEQAGPLASAQARQAVVAEEQKVALSHTQGQIMVAEQQATLKEKQLETEVRKPADAKAYEIEVVATAARKKLEIEATASAEASKLNAVATKATGEAASEVIKMTAAADAEAIRSKGTAAAETKKAGLLAEADGQRELAAALAAQDEINLRLAAIEKILAAQVQMTQAFAGPMASIGSNMKVVQITGGGSADGIPSNPVFDAMKLLPQLLTSLNSQSEALTGKGLDDLLKQAMSLVQSSKTSPVSVVEESDKKEEPPKQ